MGWPFPADGFVMQIEQLLGHDGVTIAGIVWWLLTAAALWPVFAKAGYPPWLGVVPIANLYVLVKIAGYAGPTLLLFFVPVIGWLFAVFVAVRVGDAFGQNGAFSFFLLFLLSPIGFFIVGWGPARHREIEHD